MSLIRRRNERTERQRDNETFLDSLHNKTQLNITNKRIQKWTVRGEYLYFKGYDTIFVYSISQRRVERELQHRNYFYDFAFVGDSFLVSVGFNFVRVSNATDGALLASKKYEYKDGYVKCIAVSPTSFLYIGGDTMRRLEIATSNSTAVQLEEVNTATFIENWIWPSEVCGGKIALVFENEKKLEIFDVTTFKVTAQIDLSPHFTKGFELGNYRKFDVSFPDRVVFCVGNSTHSKLKILILDPANLDVRKSFTVRNPIHSTLKQHSKLSEQGNIWIYAYASDIRMQYACNQFYQILGISIEEQKLTTSYGFHVEKFITPNCKSLNHAVLLAIKGRKLVLAETKNELEGESEKSLAVIQGPIEQFYKQCTQLGKRAVDFCEELSPALFNGSSLEFYCAHRLLMIAIQDGDVQKSLHHNDIEFKWHKVVYAESRNIKIESTEDEEEPTLILMEAVKFNVIETVGQFLLANQILAEVRDQSEKIFNMGRQLFLWVIQLEAAHMNLDLAFERYKKVQGMTELMGIALNMIPFLGGSVAAAVTAGAELVDGLQISDVLGGALQVSVDMISSSPTFEQGVLRCVESSLRKDEIKKRVELLASLQECGLTIDQLIELLQNGINRNEEKEEKKNDEPNPFENIAENFGESSISDQGTICGVSIVAELPAEDTLISTEEDTTFPEMVPTYQGAGPSNQTRILSNPKVDLSNLEEWKLSDFKKLNDDRETIRSLTIRQCSFFVSALMLLFDDDLEDEFRELQPLLYSIQRSRKISGKVFCNYLNFAKLVDGILTDLKKVYHVDEVMVAELIDFVDK